MVTIERLLDHYEREGRRGCGHLWIDLLNEIRFTHSTKRLIISYWYSVSIRKDSKQPLSLFRLTLTPSILIIGLEVLLLTTTRSRNTWHRIFSGESRHGQAH